MQRKRNGSFLEPHTRFFNYFHSCPTPNNPKLDKLPAGRNKPTVKKVKQKTRPKCCFILIAAQGKNLFIEQSDMKVDLKSKVYLWNLCHLSALIIILVPSSLKLC